MFRGYSQFWQDDEWAGVEILLVTNQSGTDPAAQQPTQLAKSSSAAALTSGRRWVKKGLFSNSSPLTAYAAQQDHLLLIRKHTMASRNMFPRGPYCCSADCLKCKMATSMLTGHSASGCLRPFLVKCIVVASASHFLHAHALCCSCSCSAGSASGPVRMQRHPLTPTASEWNCLSAQAVTQQSSQCRCSCSLCRQAVTHLHSPQSLTEACPSLS